MREQAGALLVVLAVAAGCGATVTPSARPGGSAGAQRAGWTAAESMGVPRSEHTATLLVDGTVLVAGGRTTDDRLVASAEVFDPGAGTWSTTGNMLASRAEHTAVLLRDGRVLVIGGRRIDAETYDPASRTWASAGSLQSNRHAFSATQLNDGRVLVAGGFDPGAGEVLASTELFDPQTATWTAGPPMIAARSEHAAVLLADGRVLVAGGATNQSRPTDPAIPTLASAEAFDPTTGRWTAAGEMGAAGTALTATMLPGGSALVMGGMAFGVGPDGLPNENVHLYDPATGAWNEAGKISTWVSPSAFLLPDGRVIIAGGLGASLELYDPRDETSVEVASPYAVLSGRAVTLLSDGRVLVTGGVLLDGDGSGISSEYLASAHVYTP